LLLNYILNRRLINNFTHVDDYNGGVTYKQENKQKRNMIST